MGRKREAQTGGAGYNKVFPTRLRDLLKNTKTTQAALAEHLGIARQSVAAYCSGESTPSWEGIAKIARFFSCSSDYLLGLSEYSNYSLEQITLAELGLNETTIENLEFYCKAPTGLRDIDSPETKNGINLLLGNHSIWTLGLFQRIARLETMVLGLERNIDDLIQREIDAFERDTDCCNGEIGDEYTLSPMECLEYRITRLGDLFADCVADSIGFDKLYKTLYGKGYNEMEE